MKIRVNRRKYLCHIMFIPAFVEAPFSLWCYRHLNNESKQENTIVVRGTVFLIQKF